MDAYTNSVKDSRSPSITPAPSTSTLRPRARRLISGLDEGDETTFDPDSNIRSARIASPIPSPFDSRAVSPIPASRLPRSGSSSRQAAGERNASSRNRFQGTGVRGLGGDDGAGSLAGLWGNSWSAVQAIASDLLGSDASSVQDGGRSSTRTTRTRRSLGRLQQGPRSSTSAPPSSWGPAGPTSAPTVHSIGSGTKEETEAAFRAQKRKDMLLQSESSYADTLGRFKRRSSDDRDASSAPPGENDHRDALVYLHHVQKNDTLAGITIKYSCSANTLRKANRMWPNDTVQIRRTLVLPVDACGVKGRPVPGPEGEVDLLGSESEAFQSGVAEEVPASGQPLPNGFNTIVRDRGDSTSTDTSRGRAMSSAAASSIDVDPPWHHNSWVQLPGFPKPTEIARLSRRTLGYFPPARRKSVTFSDGGPSSSFESVRTPGTEDLLNAQSSSHQDSPQRPRRTRRLSNANNGYFPSYLAGPGGVGTMGKGVLSPGPGQDGLNKMFAKHLPDVAPPRNQQALYQPDLPLYSDAASTPPVSSGARTPLPGANINLENVGGAIESWLRKAATRAKGAGERGTTARVEVGTPGAGRNGVGDLIEMTDEFEIGSDDGGEEEDIVTTAGTSARGRDAGNTATTSSRSGYFDLGVRQRDANRATGKSGKDD